MDCCGSSKPKETDKDIKPDQAGNEKTPVEKEQTHGGGCCGGSGSGMWLHLIIMLIVFAAIWYFGGR